MHREVGAGEAMPARVMAQPTWLISQVSAYSHRLLNECFAAVGARGYHYRLLAALEEFGPDSQAALGRRTAIDRSDVVAALDELTDDGFIERAPDPDDRRRNIITLTPAGAEQLDRLDRALAAVQEQLLAPLTQPDRKRFLGLLSRVLESDSRP